MHNTPQRRWWWLVGLSVGELAVLLLAHHLLMSHLAEGNVVSAIFAGGQHISPGLMITAIGFIVVRLLVVLGLPGMILARVGLCLFEYVRLRNAERGMRNAE